MSKKIFSVFLFLSFYSTLFFSVEDLNPFLRKYDSKILNNLFTVNIGIMEFKNIGNIRAIDPIDSRNVVVSMKNVLDKVPAIKLSKKEAVLKAAEVFIEKMNKKDKGDAIFLKRKLFFSKDNLERSLIYELFLEFRKDKDFFNVAKPWFENIENPFYVLNVPKPYERIVKSEEDVCEEIKSNKKIQLDFLIHGEIEKIEDIYFINVFVYSNLSKRRVKEFSFISSSEKISERSMKEIQNVLPSLFLVKYASLTIDSEDEEVRIYLDSEYIGREKVVIDTLIPGQYVIKLAKKDYVDKIENVSLSDFENKKVVINIEEKSALQIVDFYIEPLGTKIYINSVFQGRSPFKKALPIGDYIVSVRNRLYEDHRYVFSIDSIKEEESTVAFHLKSKSVKDFFKIKKMIYYSAFWNFTFSLITVVPVIVFAAEYWYRGSETRVAGGYRSQEEFDRMETTISILYGFAWATSAYAVISLGWMFFALADYLIAHEKRDFIPIIEYYHTLEDREGVALGASISF